MKRRSRRRTAFFWSMAAFIAAVGVGGGTFAGPAPLRASKSYYLPMSDGTRIALSLYFPGGNVPAKPTSTLLVQTRYGRASELEYAAGLEKAARPRPSVSGAWTSAPKKRPIWSR
jgi:predicted acyl esterase